MKRCLALVVSVAFVLGGCANGVSPEAKGDNLAALGEARIPHSQVFDVPSKINGRTYRVMVATPSPMQPGVKYPVLYVLDGNQYFGTATDATSRQSYFKNVMPCIVVGIGYPVDEYGATTRMRTLDFTPSPSSIPQVRGEFGGADAFSRILEEEIRPMINARFPVDGTRQILWGQSYAGLFALRTLFLHPGAYSHFALSSPSIWWNHREVLALEPEFLRTIESRNLHPAVLVTSAGDEQYRGADRARRAQADFSRMVDNASELADGLATQSHGRIAVHRVIFEGEIRKSVV